MSFVGYTPQEKKILDAALNVIAEHSISGTRMHLIADEAGMAPSNLHYHFKTKRELLLALLRDLQDTFDEKRSGAMANSSETLSNRIETFFDQKKQLILEKPQYDQAQFDFWVLGQSDGEINALFRRAFDQWRSHLTQSIQEFRPGVDPAYTDMAAHAMVSMMMGGSMQYLNDGAFNLDDYFTLCLELILDNIEKHAPDSSPTAGVVGENGPSNA